jgi:hypothetical protein
MKVTKQGSTTELHPRRKINTLGPYSFSNVICFSILLVVQFLNRRENLHTFYISNRELRSVYIQDASLLRAFYQINAREENLRRFYMRNTYLRILYIRGASAYSHFTKCLRTYTVSAFITTILLTLQSLRTQERRCSRHNSSSNIPMASHSGDKRKREESKEQIGPSQKVHTKSSIKAAPVTYLSSTSSSATPLSEVNMTTRNSEP